MNTLSVGELCDLGDRHAISSEWEEADKVFDRALSLDAKSKRALLGRVTALRAGRYDYARAQSLLSRCFYHYPEDTEPWIEQGRLYCDTREYQKAIGCFERVLSREPTNQGAIEGKVRTLVADGRASDAHNLIAGLALGATRPEWLTRELAQVHLAQGEYPAAVEAFLDFNDRPALYLALSQQVTKPAKDALASAILARLGNDTTATRAVATAHAAWGDLNAATAAYKQIIDGTPGDEDAHSKLIDLLRRQERFADADAAYRNAVKSLGNSSDLLRLAHASALFDAGERDRASEALTEVTDHKQLFSFLSNLRDDDATHAFEVLMQRQPSNTTLAWTAASRLNAGGNARKALQLFERILELDPNDTRAMLSKGNILLAQERLADLDSLLKQAAAKAGSMPSEFVGLQVSLLIARERYADAVSLAVSAGQEQELQSLVDSLLTAGNLAKAEKLVNAAVAYRPDSIPLLRAQGRLLLQQRSYEAAARVWDVVWEKDPDDVTPLLNHTFALREIRRFEEVQQTLDQAMRRAASSGRVSLFVEYALLYNAQGRYDEAVAAFDSALHIDASYGFAHLWKIRTLTLASRHDEAEAAVKQALSIETLSVSERAEITCQMGMIYESREDWKSAGVAYGEARRIDPKLASAHFQQASALLRLNRNDEAEQLVENLLKERGTENEVQGQAGWFYLSKKDFRKAEAQFRAVLQRPPVDVSALNGLGALYFEQGKFALAEQHFRRVLEIDKADAAWWNNLAWALVRQANISDPACEAQLTEAERDCRKAIELFPRFASAYACLGIIAFKRGRVLECEDFLKRAIELDPRESSPADLGALYTHLGRYEDAQRVLEKGRSVNRYDVGVRVELGNVYLLTGQTKQAIAVLREACAIDPQAPDPVRALAIAFSTTGDLTEAQHLLRSAIRRQDKSSVPTLRVALCRVLTELAEKSDDAALYAEALREVRLAIQAQPKNPDAFFNAGVVCFKQGDYGAAVKHFKQCHLLDESNFEAEQNLRKLKTLSAQAIGRARIGVWVGSIVGVVCFGLLIALWWIYLRQPLPATKDAVQQIDGAILLTLSPLLLALIFVALLLPWLNRLKLPGGVEAEIAQPNERISSGPSGPPTISTGSAAISTGPR